MEIITAIKSWFFGDKPLASHRWKFLHKISSATCAEAEKPTAGTGSMGPLVGLQLASPPSRCAGFGTRASLRSPCSCLLWQLEGIALLLPRAPGSCARAARSRTPPAHKDCSLWQKQRLAAWAWTVSLCQMLWAGARECPWLSSQTLHRAFPTYCLAEC